MLGVMDGAVLERLAKIMGYMRVAPGAKPGKRLKKRDKQRMLAGGTPIGSGGAPTTPSSAGECRLRQRISTILPAVVMALSLLLTSCVHSLSCV